MANYNKLLDIQIDCECGRTHFVPIKEVNFNFKEEELPLICKKYFAGKKSFNSSS